MEKKNSNLWVVIAVVTAVVAALAAVVYFVLRARSKQKAWYDEEAIDCEMDDCVSFEFDDEGIEVADAGEEE